MVTGTHHPWKELRERGDGVVLHRTKFNDTRIAATNGNNAIWLDADLLQVERRCAVQHEQAHIDLGHTNCDNPKGEGGRRDGYGAEGDRVKTSVGKSWASADFGQKKSPACPVFTRASGA